MEYASLSQERKAERIKKAYSDYIIKESQREWDVILNIYEQNKKLYSSCIIHGDGEVHWCC